MVIGLREFRQKLSEYISLSRRDRLIFVSKANHPVAAMVGIDKLRELAHKAGDNFILSQLEEIGEDRNKLFIAEKMELSDKTQYYLAIQKEKGSSTKTISKLETLLAMIENLVGNDGTSEDRRILFVAERTLVELVTETVKRDYYFVTRDFGLELHRSLTQLVLTKHNLEGKKVYEADVRKLMDLFEHIKIRQSHDEIETAVKPFTTCLLEVTDSRGQITFQVYYVLPDWINLDDSKQNFLGSYSQLWKKIQDKKEGDGFEFHGQKHKILSIS